MCLFWLLCFLKIVKFLIERLKGAAPLYVELLHEMYQDQITHVQDELDILLLRTWFQISIPTAKSTRRADDAAAKTKHIFKEIQQNQRIKIVVVVATNARWNEIHTTSNLHESLLKRLSNLLIKRSVPCSRVPNVKRPPYWLSKHYLISGPYLGTLINQFSNLLFR